MAVPKSKVSKARGAKRFASNYKATMPTLVECPQCHERKQSHKVCAKCGKVLAPRAKFCPDCGEKV